MGGIPVRVVGMHRAMWQWDRFGLLLDTLVFLYSTYIPFNVLSQCVETQGMTFIENVL